MKDIESQVKLFLSDSKKLENFFGYGIDFIFSCDLDTLLPEKLEFDFQTAGLLLNEKSTLVEKVSSIQPDQLISQNSISQCIGPETLNCLCELASTPGYEPSKEFLVRLLNQKPIVELLAGIIESAIVEFNKKINPFFGAIQATGLDKQIKMFVYPFLPGLLSKIADFMYNSPKGEEGRELIRNSTKVFLSAEFSEFKGPNDSELKEMKENFTKLKDSVLKDDTLGDTLKNIYNAFRSHLTSSTKSIPLRDLVGMGDSQFEVFKKNTSSVFAKNILNFKNASILEKTLSSMVSEILTNQ